MHVVNDFLLIFAFNIVEYDRVQPDDFLRITEERTGEEIPILIPAVEERLGGVIAAINSIYSNTRSNVVFYIITTNDTMSHLRWTWLSNNCKYQSIFFIFSVPSLIWLQNGAVVIILFIWFSSWLQRRELMNIKYKILEFDLRILKGKVRSDDDDSPEVKSVSTPFVSLCGLKCSIDEHLSLCTRPQSLEDLLKIQKL